jgi:hypothetical protein
MNAYVKIAIAAMAAVYLTPPIINRFVVPEVGDSGAMRNDITAAGITGLVTAGVFVMLGMAT